MATPTNLPIRISQTDRRLLQSAAERRNLKISTYVRAVALAVARAELAQQRETKGAVGGSDYLAELGR